MLFCASFPRLCLCAIYYKQHSEVAACTFQPRQASLGAPGSRGSRASAGSARTGASNAVPYLGGKSARGRLRVRASGSSEWLGRLLGRTRCWGDPAEAGVRECHTCITAPAPPQRAAGPATPSTQGGEVWLLGSTQRDQILTRFLPGLGIKGIGGGHLFSLLNPLLIQDGSVWDSLMGRDPAGDSGCLDLQSNTR